MIIKSKSNILLENPTKDKIINQLATRKDIKKIISNITEEDSYYQDELYQELFLVLCELDEEKLISMYTEGWLDYYMIATLSNMFNSVSSRFYNKIKKPIMMKQDHVTEEGTDMIEEFASHPQFALPDKSNASIETEHQYMDELEKAIDKLYWFDKEIVKHYLKHGTIKKVAEITNLSTWAISITLQKSRKELKKLIGEGITLLHEQNFFV